MEQFTMSDQNKILWDVLSPDGFPIGRDEYYDGPEEAEKAFYQWLKRYELQGYYSSVKHGRIPLNEVEHYIAYKRYVKKGRKIEPID